jgi:hypothetical protein
MTTIITRLYADMATARGVANALVAQGHGPDTIDVIARDGAGDVTDRMRDARVSAAATAAYAPGVSGGNALLVMRAPFAPMGAARNAMKTVDRTPSIKVGLATENDYVREQPVVMREGLVMTSHPLLMTNPHRSMSHGHILGSNPLRPHRTGRSAIAGGKHMSRMFWPMRLVSAQAKEGTSAIRGGWLFSSMFGLPTLLR